MPYTFQKPKRRVTRVFLHCSASDNPAHDNVATMDQWHKERGWSGVGYHFFVRKSGLLELGRDLEKIPAAQEDNNTGTIAICLHGLKAENFTKAQLETVQGLCFRIALAYNGNVTFHGHCEVARKACPVFDYKQVLKLDAAGNLPHIRTAPAMTSFETPRIAGLEALEEPNNRGPASLKHGDKGGAVETLQKKLSALGYLVGRIDGDFGDRTRNAVLAFQADNHLTTDGKFGELSREALKSAEPAPVSKARSMATLASLSSEGNPIAKATGSTTIAGALLSVGGLLSALNDTSGLVTELTGSMGEIGKVLDGLGQWQGVALAGLGIYVVVRSVAAGRSHVAEYRSGKTS